MHVQSCCFAYKTNKPFPSFPGPLFQNEGRCSAFDVKIIFHSHANKTHFHKKGCAPSLILKVRVFGTRNWHIIFWRCCCRRRRRLSSLLSDQDSKAVHKRADLIKLKGNGCNLLKGKGSAYYAAIGYKIVTIQIEGYSGVNRQKVDRLTAWNINVGKPIYNTFIYVMIKYRSGSTRSTSL